MDRDGALQKKREAEAGRKVRGMRLSERIGRNAMKPTNLAPTNDAACTHVKPLIDAKIN
jgi:hypothetical protein